MPRPMSPTLRHLMADKKVKPKDVALFCGVSGSTVSLWRSGRMFPNGYHFDRLCLLLNCTWEELLRAIHGSHLKRGGDGQAAQPAAD
jgi:DNA-binding Xre family transcriptional regulator